jgi:hypothetical protein
MGYEGGEGMSGLQLTDKQLLETMLAALDASPRTLERPICRGWLGDWQISGKSGHIMTDGHGFAIYVATNESPRRWTAIKKRLGFCRVTIRIGRHALLATRLGNAQISFWKTH